MKRVALLAMTAMVAFVLSACGESAERKAETNAATPVEQTQDATTHTPDVSQEPASGASTTPAPSEPTQPTNPQ